MKVILSVEDLTYTSPTGRQIINRLSFSIACEKIGLVGRNGVGKSTLIRLMVHQIESDHGTCKCFGKISYVPQVMPCKRAQEVQQIKEEVQKELQTANLDSKLRNMILLKLETKCNTTNLSGGEQKLLHILRAFSEDSDFIILDEPECSLDIQNRRFLRLLMQKTTKGILLVSHDESFLNVMDEIIEFREQGIRKFSGNFNLYKKNVSEEVKELDKKVKGIEKELYYLQHKQTKAVHCQLYRMSKADDETKDKGYGDFWCDTPKKDRASRTLKRIKKMYDDKQKEGKQILEDYIDRATLVNKYSLPVPDIQVNSLIPILEMNKCNFSYIKGEKLIVDFSLTVYAGEKVALIGSNGIGKTTLMKIIIGELKAIGELKRYWKSVVYLDQFVSCFNMESSLIQSIKKRYRVEDDDLVEEYIRSMGYPLPQAYRKCKDLSGGEMIVASLLILFFDKNAPELLLLDEPVNHLDFAGVNILLNMINSYKGAVIIISHDECFLKNIKNLKVVDLEKQNPVIKPG